MDESLSILKGVGPKRLAALEKAGLRTIGDLLGCLPSEYRDLDDVRPLGTLEPDGQAHAVRARVVGAAKPFRKGALTIVSAKLSDESGEMKAVWYNQAWISEKLVPGRELLLYGKAERGKGGGIYLTNPAFVEGSGIQPVYRPMEGIPSKSHEKLTRLALDVARGQLADELSQEIRTRYKLCERNFAVESAHFPITREALDAARRRLAFEELLIYQLALWLMRGARSEGVALDPPENIEAEYWGMTPFSPTDAQRRTLGDVVADLRERHPMARLLQGDVGCGKTAVAFGALYACVKCGWQGALMAPTEILANQHYASARAFFEPLGIECGLLTGSLTPKKRALAREEIASGRWRVIIGTHALISEGVEYEKLGLAITDEQHRFGVRQRTKLSGKGDSPNVLVMSATPIPRTLSLIIYGDLDISVIDELPPGRTPVITRVVPEAKRAAMYGFIREQAARGFRTYIVCPLVEDSEIIDALAAERLYEELRSGPLKELRVGLSHGRMKAAERDKAIAALRSGELDALVSTTVIEVGVNVPEATVMVIENAERFGLAQLHQLRGRVGRGAAESYCFLMSEPNERLKLLASTHDGFVIAQKDMELRGPGEVLGERQSGPIAPALAAAGDVKLLEETHLAAREIAKAQASPEYARIMELARELLDGRMRDIAMN